MSAAALTRTNDPTTFVKVTGHLFDKVLTSEAKKKKTKRVVVLEVVLGGVGRGHRL